MYNYIYTEKIMKITITTKNSDGVPIETHTYPDSTVAIPRETIAQTKTCLVAADDFTENAASTISTNEKADADGKAIDFTS